MPTNQFQNPYAQVAGGVSNLGNAIVQALFPNQGAELQARQALAGAEQSLAGAERNRAQAGYYGARTGYTNEQANDLRFNRAGRTRLSDAFLNGSDAERYAASVLAGDDFLKVMPGVNLGFRSTQPGATPENLAPLSIGAGEDYQNTAPGRVFIENQNTARNKYNTDTRATTDRREQNMRDARERSKPVAVSNGGTVVFNPSDTRIPQTAVGGVFTAPNTGSSGGASMPNVGRLETEAITATVNGYLDKNGINLSQQDRLELYSRIGTEFQRTKNMAAAFNNVFGQIEERSEPDSFFGIPLSDKKTYSLSPGSTASTQSPQASVQSSLPPGIPAGSVQIGTSQGKPVYKTPDGRQLIVE